MHIKWIIVLVVSIVYLMLNLMRKQEDSGGSYNFDLGGCFYHIVLFVLYLIFWIIWLIIF
jgi:hypothetical protein